MSSPPKLPKIEEGEPSSTLSQSTQRRRSSFFKQLTQNFRRTGGAKGADVRTLRGTNGADFEGKGRVARVSSDSVGCLCFGGGGNSTGDARKERLLLIKGPFCFVYTDEEATAPKYAISLVDLKAELKAQAATTVVLTTTLGDAQYEIHFATPEAANQFVTAVRQQAAKGESDRARERLGHGALLNKRASVRYAEAVAKDKLKEQPSAPLTAGEVLQNMPNTEAMPGL